MAIELVPLDILSKGRVGQKFFDSKIKLTHGLA